MQLMENKATEFISSGEKNKIKMCWTTHYVLVIYKVTIKPQLCEN